MKLNIKGHHRILITGEAGVGKSTLSNRLVTLWASGKLSTPFWDRIKTVIFVTSVDEGDDLKQTMINAIPGKQAYKDLTLDLYRDEPESVLVIIEGFNEFQNPRVIKEMTQLLRDEATNVFLTMRNNSNQLTSNFRKMFNGSFEINGFSDVQSETYARKILKELQHRMNKNETYSNEASDGTVEFIRSIKNKPKVWNSPLNLSLACLLFIEGELNPSDMAELTEVSLYTTRENRMVERELHDQELCDVKSIAKIELNKIHKLALYLLVTNSTKCTEDDLKHFKISQNSMALVLLEKEERYSARHGHSNSWTWPHTRLLEFDAASCLTNMKEFINSQWLYWISSKPSLNPVADLVATILGIDKRYGDVKALTTVSILLQSKTECSASCKSVQNEKHQCSWIGKYKEKSDSNKSLNACFPDGVIVIQQLALELPDLTLLCECRGSLFNGNVSLFKHIQECWKLGGLNENEHEFITSIEKILLPAIDRLVLLSSLCTPNMNSFFLF